MTNPHELEPLDPELASLFEKERAAHPAEPLARDAVLERVERAVKLQVLAEVALHGERALRTLTKVKLAAAALALFGAGLVVGRETAPLGRPAPVLPSATPVTLSPPTATSASTPPSDAPSASASASAAPPVPTPPRAPASVPTSTASDLAKEQELVDTARVALARGRAGDALEAAAAHAKRFPHGRLTEEREALAIQALAMAGQGDAARARAASFRRRYPASIFTRVIDDVTSRQ